MLTIQNGPMATNCQGMTRRTALKAGFLGLTGLSLADVMRQRAQGNAASSEKSVILLWLDGGPSHFETYDPKPDAPAEYRGPFNSIQTNVPGVRLCEYLPKQAAMLDKLTIIRSVDCRFSNHEPNMVMQTANRQAEHHQDAEAEGGFETTLRPITRRNHQYAYPDATKRNAYCCRHKAPQWRKCDRFFLLAH